MKLPNFLPNFQQVCLYLTRNEKHSAPYSFQSCNKTDGCPEVTSSGSNCYLADGGGLDNNTLVKIELILDRSTIIHHEVCRG